MIYPSVPILLLAISAPVTRVPEMSLPYAAQFARYGMPSVIGGAYVHSRAPSEIAANPTDSLIVVSQARPVLTEIAAYRSLPHGWDAEDAQPALQWSADAATAFIEKLPANVPDPIPMISGSGEVGLYWMDGKAYVEVGFDEQGRCFLFAEKPGLAPIHLDEQDLDAEAIMQSVMLVLGIDRQVVVAA